MASATEAEVGAAFISAQEGCAICTTLEEMGHPTHDTMKTDNQTEKGIISQTVKQHKSKAIDMRFYCIKNHIDQGQYTLYWRLGSIYLADYFNKHFSPTHY